MVHHELGGKVVCDRIGPPRDLEQVGICAHCGVELYHSEDQPTCEDSNVGDYDFVYYPCQFELADNGEWEAFKELNQ